MGQCYDKWGPMRCGKKFAKGKCYKRKKPTKPKGKMLRRCAFTYNFCHLREPDSILITG